MKLTEENYVEIAEQVIKKLHEEKNQKGQPIGIVTTSKIRNLLSMTANIYNDVVNTKSEHLSNEVIGRINYLKLKTECTSKRSQLATLESQLAELKEDNDAYESQVTSSVDLERIRKIAIGRLGMKYPSNQQTETYATEGGSYVRQYQDVTGK